MPRKPIKRGMKAFSLNESKTGYTCAWKLHTGADDLLEPVIDAVQRGLEYGDSFLELTPLVRPTTRLTLSNVYPEIPNSVLVSNISSFCKVVSQIRSIPLGFKNK